MLVVRVELWSAISGEATEIARMHISNIGGTKERGEYLAEAFLGSNATDFDKRVVKVSGQVADYPRLSLDVWNLVARALKSLIHKIGIIMKRIAIAITLALLSVPAFADAPTKPPVSTQDVVDALGTLTTGASLVRERVVEWGTALQGQVSQLQSQIAALQGQVTKLQADDAAKTQYWADYIRGLSGETK